MDELERRIREANPYEKCELPEHAEKALNEIMQGRRRARTQDTAPLISVDIALMSAAAIVTLTLGMHPTSRE